MARSFQKTKIFGITTAKSEKFDKRTTNKKFRKKVKESINSNIESLPLIREISNVWLMAKDGKMYWSNATKADLRK